jgi:acetyl/propionyl-CoA carboxylase alpha subunit
MGAAAVDAARAVGYEGAGTVEFLMDDTGTFYFLEMNTRLQVEHPVTELVTGLDLVELQLAVAEGDPLPPEALEPGLTGHAIEARLTAEDPAADYRPATGPFVTFDVDDAAVRVDTGIESGSTVAPFYDSMIAKVIAHGPTRAAAIRSLRRALATARLHGPTTNRDQLVRILDHPAFLAGDLHTGFLDEHPCTEPITGDRDLALAAVALAEQAANRSAATALAQIPSGWRNNPAVDQSLQMTDGDTTTTITYRLGAAGHVSVDGRPLDVEILTTMPGEVVLASGGVQHRVRIGRDGDRRYVDGLGGHLTVTVLPRHPDPTTAHAAGSLVAPMPGAVLRVLVAPGATVTAGDPLVVLEAMKMEHQIAAPTDGTVAEINVAVGEQVETGQLLLVVTESAENPENPEDADG